MSEIFRLDETWSGLKEKDELLLYGVGRIGRRVIPKLMQEFTIPFLIDQRCSGEYAYGLEIVSLQEALHRLHKHVKIVVTTVRASYEEIAKELEAAGYQEYKDFCLFERFVGEWNLRWKNRLVLAKIDTVITSRCTLKCRNCNMFIGYVPNPEDIHIDVLKKNFDTFFDSVDFVYEYTLLGGEPFLHRDLASIITYLEEQYGDRIGTINLISNGTVLPKEEIINVLAHYHVTVHISDYSCSVDYGGRLKSLIESLTNAGVDYYVIPNNVWKDVVYPRQDYFTDDPRGHMLTCGHSTHSVDYGKLYWCDPAFAAEHFTKFPSKNDDYLDLDENKVNYSQYDASVNVLRYLLGDVNERGYMTICEKCAGVGKDNKNIVKAGIQNNVK